MKKPLNKYYALYFWSVGARKDNGVIYSTASTPQIILSNHLSWTGSYNRRIIIPVPIPNDLYGNDVSTVKTGYYTIKYISGNSFNFKVGPSVTTAAGVFYPTFSAIYGILK